MRPEVGRKRQGELSKGTQWKQLANGDASGRLAPDSRGDQSDEIGSSHSEGKPIKMSQHSSWVVEFSLEIQASVVLHMHIENAVLHNTPSCILHMFVCYFSPTPLIMFLVAMKKCAIPLLEPLDDHRPRRKMFKKLTYLGSRGGIVTSVCYLIPKASMGTI